MQVFELGVKQIKDKIIFSLMYGDDCLYNHAVNALGFLKISKLDSEMVINYLKLNGVNNEHGKIIKNVMSMVGDEPPVKSIKHVLEPINLVVTGEHFTFAFRDVVANKVVSRQLPHDGKYSITPNQYKCLIKELENLYVLNECDRFLNSVYVIHS